MAGVHEKMEHAEHAEHAGRKNKQIALLISVIALFLAFAETLGKACLGAVLLVTGSHDLNPFVEGF